MTRSISDETVSSSFLVAPSAASRWALLILAALLVISIVARIGIVKPYKHPDETIVVELVPSLLRNQTLDTNWDRNLKSEFKYPMYNFSSYYLVLAMLSAPAYWLASEQPSLQFMRILSMIMGVAIIAFVFLIAKLLSDDFAAVTAALFATFSPQLFLDSIYARPDTFFTLLMLVAVYVVLRKPRAWTLFWSSVLIGFLASSKIYALAFAPLPLLVVTFSSDALSLQRLIRLVALAVSGIFLGAFIGAPYSFVNYDVWIAGYRLSANYYQGSSGPHGLRQAPLMARLVYLANYLAPTVGWAVLGASFAAPFVLAKHNWRASMVSVVTLIISWITVIFTGTRGLFIERNFSNALPFLFIFAGIGIAGVVSWGVTAKLRAVVTCAVALLSVVPSASVLAVVRFDYLAKGEDRINAARAAIVSKYPNLQFTGWPNLTYGNPLKDLRQHVSKMPFPFIIELLHFDDRFSEATMQEFLSAYRYEKIGEIPDPLRGISPSTMHAYALGSRLLFKIEGLK